MVRHYNRFLKSRRRPAKRVPRRTKLTLRPRGYYKKRGPSAYNNYNASVLQRFFRRKVSKSNNQIVARRNIDNTTITHQPFPIYWKFVANADVSAGVNYRANNDLYSVAENLFQTATTLKYTDEQGDKTKYSREIYGFRIRLNIIALTNLTTYVKVIVARDKYEIFPGFQRVDKNNQFSGVFISIKPPSNNNNDPNQTAFFRDYADDNNITNFKDIKQNIRSVTPLNALRYQVLYQRIFKLSYSSSSATTQNVRLINTFIKYKKTLFYQFNEKYPTNDCAKMFIFVSNYPPGIPKVGVDNALIAEVTGTINVIGRSQLYNATNNFHL